jgi:hypothetical protein
MKVNGQFARGAPKLATNLRAARGKLRAAQFTVQKRDFAKLTQKSLFSTQKHLFKSYNIHTTDSKHVYE